MAPYRCRTSGILIVKIGGYVDGDFVDTPGRSTGHWSGLKCGGVDTDLFEYGIHKRGSKLAAAVIKAIDLRFAERRWYKERELETKAMYEVNVKAKDVVN